MFQEIPCVVRFGDVLRFYVVSTRIQQVVSFLAHCGEDKSFVPIIEKGFYLTNSDAPGLRRYLCEGESGFKPCEFNFYDEAKLAAVKASMLDFSKVDFRCLKLPV